MDMIVICKSTQVQDQTSHYILRCTNKLFITAATAVFVDLHMPLFPLVSLLVPYVQ